MTASREIQMAAGTSRLLEFATTYSAEWSVVVDRGVALRAADVASARFLLKRRISDTDAQAKLAKTTASGISIATGKATVTLAAGDTDDLQGEYVCTLRLYMVSGAVLDWEDADYDGKPYVTIKITQGAVEAIV